jgi:eukaryotic-like serine/threonine-protein kinase
VSADGDHVAVKVIRADLAMDPEFRARFRREVTVARKVSSRFTAPLIAADADGPVPWLATAYVTGPSLADAIAQRGPLPAASVLELAAGLAEGMSAIHSAGVIHRDLKPSNVLLAQDGPRVIDFGISVAAETSQLTRAGLLIGSPGYMSPEQVEGREVGPASDIFSLGAVLAFAATGEAPFGNGSAPTLAYRAVYRQVNLDRVPAEVRGLIDRCLAKDPGQRPAARDLMFAAAAIPPTERWAPAPVTRTFTELPAGQDGSRTLTSARLSSVSQTAPDRADRQQGRRQQGRRQRRRPLAIASVVVGILAASAAGGIAVAGCTSQTVGVHSVSSPVTSAPTRSAPSTSPTAIVAPSTAPSATASATPTASATATPTAITTGTPTASPTATATGTPTATVTATATATPTAITTGTATATPAP